MGCFNVACGASNISIGYGDEVVFIPLRKGRYAEKDEANSMIIYPEDILSPALLPIKGKYNDYGSIEDIIKDENIKALEKVYNISIEQIIELMTDGREPLEPCSSTFNIFNIEEFGYGEERNINEKNLLTVGFIKNEDGNLYNPNVDYTIDMEKSKFEDDGSSSELVIKAPKVFDSEISKMWYNKNGGESHITETKYISDLNELQAEIFKTHSYIITLTEDKQECVKTIKDIKSLYGMFVHRDIYDTFVQGSIDEKNVNKNLKTRPIGKFMEILGFTKKGKGKQNQFNDRDCEVFERNGNIVKVGDFGAEINDIKKSLYYMEDFYNLWEKTTQEKLDQSKIYDISSLQLRIIEKLDYPLSGTFYETMLEREEGEEEPTDDKRKRMIELAKNNPSEGFKRLIGGQRWEDFTEFYSPILFDKAEEENYDIVNSIVEFMKFHNNFWSTNHFYHPTCNGEQHGNDEASKMLYEKALQVINKNIDKYKEDSREYDTVVEYFNYENKNVTKACKYLDDLMKDFKDEELYEVSGLSKFEIHLFKKDRTNLKEILNIINE